VKELCHDVDHGVEVPVVRVHAKAFDRIAANQCAYAPVSLNRDFDLIGEDPRYKTMQDFLHPEGDVLQRAWDIVWWRRLAYFATLTVTAYLSLFVLRLMFTWPDGILRITEAGLSAVFGVRITGWFAQIWAWFLGLIAHVLPDWMNALIPSFDSFEQRTGACGAGRFVFSGV